MEPNVMRSLRLVVLAAALSVIGPPAARAADSPAPASLARIAPSLARAIEADPGAEVSAWVHFADRAGRDRDPAAYALARRAFTARSLARRARRGTVTDLVDSDLPVHEPYVRALLARGARLRGTSRWLNAASVSMPAGLAREIARWPFVARVELVPVGRRPRPILEPEPSAKPAAPALDVAPAPPALELAPGDTAYYGASFKQLAMMQVPQLHAAGLTGAGVLVALLDSGYRLTHQAFAGLDVVAKRDFIHGDTTVDNEAGQDLAANQYHHGTWTLSCVAGSRPGTFSGVAFGASVALAKTEEIPTETPVEMDYWQFGAEWADSLGADVISSSLGYFDFPDDTASSYTYADLDGQTTVVTRAAAEAVRRGIVVVNSAGNGGPGDSTLIAPADGDSVITSGAVDSLGVVTSFSSRGPTADGRIKPDVTAMGRSVFMVSVLDTFSYQRASGTSFSCPLTSGLVALLLEAHPDWRPFEVREALRATALNAGAPNHTIGWGLVQGAAANAHVPSTTGAPRPVAARGFELSAAPNPMRAGAGASIRLAAPSGTRVTLDVIDLAGRRRARLFEGALAGPRDVAWSGTDDRGRPLAAGVYWLRLGAEARVSMARKVVLTR
jgi:subtilisin family serine protease